MSAFPVVVGTMSQMTGFFPGKSFPGRRTFLSIAADGFTLMTSPSRVPIRTTPPGAFVCARAIVVRSAPSLKAFPWKTFTIFPAPVTGSSVHRAILTTPLTELGMLTTAGATLPPRVVVVNAIAPRWVIGMPRSRDVASTVSAADVLTVKSPAGSACANAAPVAASSGVSRRARTAREAGIDGSLHRSGMSSLRPMRQAAKCLTRQNAAAEGRPGTGRRRRGPRKRTSAASRAPCRCFRRW